MPSSLPPHPSGSISITTVDGEPVLCLRGEIDAAAVEAFDAAGEVDLGTAAPMRVDAAAVTFMSSMGVRLLLHWTTAAREAGLRPVLVRPSRSVRQVLRLAGVDALFVLED